MKCLSRNNKSLVAWTLSAYRNLDGQIAFNFRAELDETLEKLNFKYISQAVSYLYYKKGLSTTEVANKLNTTKFTVNRWMATWNMERRPRGGYNKKWAYAPHCKKCNRMTRKGYRAKGLCWPCYQKDMRKKYN